MTNLTPSHCLPPPSLPLPNPSFPPPQSAAGTATLALCVLYIFACIGFWGFAKDFRVNPSDSAAGHATGCDTLLGEKGRGHVYTPCCVVLCCVVWGEHLTLTHTLTYTTLSLTHIYPPSPLPLAIECVHTFFHQGLRDDTGISNYMDPERGGFVKGVRFSKQPLGEILLRWLFEVSYFLLFTLLLLAMVNYLLRV